MFLKIYKPSQALSPFVFHYVIFEDEGTLREKPFNIVSNGLPELALHFGDHCTSYINYMGEVNSGYIYGPQTKTGFFQSHGLIKCLCILFRPLGAYEIFGYPQSEYRNYAVNLDALYGIEGINFIEKITLAASYEERIKITDDFLMMCLKATGEKDISIADYAIEAIQKSGGKIKIQQLCDIFDLSIKTLERRIEHLMGLTPKEFISTIRVNRAFLIMKNNPGIDIQDIVYKCGYYDQSHFIKEFKNFTKYTPDSIRNDADYNVIYLNRMYTFYNPDAGLHRKTNPLVNVSH